MRPPLSLSSPDGWKITLNEEETGMTVTVEHGMFRLARFVDLGHARQIYDWVGALLNVALAGAIAAKAYLADSGSTPRPPSA